MLTKLVWGKPSLCQRELYINLRRSNSPENVLMLSWHQMRYPNAPWVVWMIRQQSLRVLCAFSTLVILGSYNKRYLIQLSLDTQLSIPLPLFQMKLMQNASKRQWLLAAVGFEPTPPQRLVPKTSALDHSATLPAADLWRFLKCLITACYPSYYLYEWSHYYEVHFWFRWKNLICSNTKSQSSSKRKRSHISQSSK